VNEHTTKADEASSLAAVLVGLLRAHAGEYRQERTYRRVVSLVLGAWFANGRRTVTQELLALGLEALDWSAWYRLFSRGRFSEEAAGRVLLRESLAHVGAQEPYVVGTDGVRFPRSSRTMPGTSWWPGLGMAPFRRGLQRAQRFVHGAWLTPMAEGYSRAVPLRLLPAFPASAVAAAGVTTCREWEAGLAFVRWVRQEVDAAGRRDQPLLWLADGSYDVTELWGSLPDRCVLAVRTARNRALFALPAPSTTAAHKEGRPPKYGERMPTPAEWVRQRQGWTTVTLGVRGKSRPVRYRVEGPYLCEGMARHPLFLIVIGGHSYTVGKRRPKQKAVKPCYYLVNAQEQAGTWQLPLPITTLLTWLWQRWELEVAHREMKSEMGVGEIQCWGTHSAVLAVQWSVWCYALLIFAGYRTWGVRHGPPALGRWRTTARRWSIATLLRHLRASLWQNPEFRTVWLPSSDNWAKTDAWIALTFNAAATSTRL
jgi:hypothetical protein